MSKEKTNSLLNCPFCDGELLVDGKFYVHPVVGCLLDGIPIRNDTESIKRWNTRIPMRNIVERLEECYERYEDLEYYEHLENGHSLDFEYCHGKKDGVNEAIEIVKEEGGVDV